jgi:outer membrane protein insertion porin family
LLHVLLLQVVQATLQAGFLTRISNSLNIGICDQFFLGGPLSLRGFQARGVGPHKDGNALGANVSDGCNNEAMNLSYLYA